MQKLLIIAVAALLASGGAAVAQQLARIDLEGTWTLVTAGKSYGPNPKGYLIFDDDGYFSTQIMKSDLPKYTSGKRTEGTPEEYAATIGGYIGYFGTFAFSGDDLTFRIEGSSFPNWNGTNQKRTNVKIVGDQLSYTVPSQSADGTPLVVVWKRPKIGPTSTK